MINTLSSEKNVSPVSNIGLTNKKLWRSWILILTVTFVVQLFTVDLLPDIQKDEVQITDYGRLALNPESNWAATWLIATNKPLFIWSYVGPLIGEIGYRLGNDSSGTGTRIVSMLGGLLAATMALCWLLSRRIAPLSALSFSVVFLLDPLFTLTQRLGRVDSWVMALCLATCFLLRREALKATGQFARGGVISAGALTAIATFIWPSSVFLYPLIIHEFIYLSRGKIEHGLSFNRVLLLALYFVLSGVLATVLLLIPISNHLSMIVGDMSNVVTQNIQSSKSVFERTTALFDLQLWLKTIKAFAKTLSPFLPLVGLFAALYKRDKGLIFVTILTIMLIFATLVYEYRLVYLFPYFLALSSSAFEKIRINANPSLKRFSVVAIISVISWAVGVSLITRTILGKESDEINRTLIYKTANTSIGAGEYKVFLAYTYELYFAARSLGWHVYLPYIQYEYDEQGNWIQKNDYKPEDKFRKLLSQMDYAIFPKGTITTELSRQLQESGLYYKSTIQIGNNSNKKISKSSSRIKDIILWFLQGNQCYRTYLLYAHNNSINK